MARATGLKVIASGGVSSIEDIKKLKEMEAFGVDAVILGKSLYAGTVDLEEALRTAKGEIA
jgi:phosphoribosylformimino-5-aminoimidazole carboxamide ribotide isomerase